MGVGLLAVVGGDGDVSAVGLFDGGGDAQFGVESAGGVVDGIAGSAFDSKRKFGGKVYGLGVEPAADSEVVDFPDGGVAVGADFGAWRIEVVEAQIRTSFFANRLPTWMELSPNFSPLTALI